MVDQKRKPACLKLKLCSFDNVGKNISPFSSRLNISMQRNWGCLSKHKDLWRRWKWLQISWLEQGVNNAKITGSIPLWAIHWRVGLHDPSNSEYSAILWLTQGQIQQIIQLCKTIGEVKLLKEAFEEWAHKVGRKRHMEIQGLWKFTSPLPQNAYNFPLFVRKQDRNWPLG